MKKWKTEAVEASIILVGNFNPSIFHPEWFIRHELSEEWDYSESTINTPDFSRIQFSGERNLEVLQDRFSYRTKVESSHLELKDLVLSTFSILSHTPINQLGLNLTPLINIPVEKDWTDFGLDLAPIDLWMKAAPYIENLDINKKKTLGLSTLKMSLPRPDDLPGFINVEISNVRNRKNAITFGLNFHFDISEEEEKAMSAVKIIEENWEASLKLGKQIVDTIMESHLGNKK